MHPVEHVLYFSSVLIHFFIESHPIHVLLHLHFAALGAVLFHTGFEGIVVKGRLKFLLGSFHHQVHHQYYNRNYGTESIPFDKWLGWNHNGTQEATGKMMAYLRVRMPRKRNVSAGPD